MSPVYLAAPYEPEEEEEKFTKEQAGYKAQALIYKCRSCRHYNAARRKCNLVDESGEPDPGEILPNASSKLWNAGFIRTKWRKARFGRGAKPPA